MAQIFADRADDFIDALSTILSELSGGDGHQAEVNIEAANLVAALLDADERHTVQELDGWTRELGARLDPPIILTSAELRADDTFGGRRAWLTAPSTMFDLLVRADARDDQRRAATYYERAMALAMATAAIDLVPSPTELDAIDSYRTLLLAEFDTHGVPRPGRPASTRRSSDRNGPPSARAGVAATATGASAPAAPEPELPPARPVEELLAELDALIGLAGVKAEVRRLTSLLRITRIRAEHGLPTVDTSRHLVFSGNPGTGKTTVGRLLSQIYRSLGIVERGHLVETDRSDLVAGFVGQTAEKTRAVMESALGGTLLIDEAYSLARGSATDFGREAIDTIVKFMEDHRDDLSVIAAGYPREMEELVDANPGLKSRFTKTIHFPDYSTDELIGIFELISGSKEYHLDAGARTRLAEVIDAEPRGKGFGNGRFVRNIFEAAIGNQALRLADVAEPTAEQLTTLTADDIGPVDLDSSSGTPHSNSAIDDSAIDGAGQSVAEPPTSDN